MSGPKGKPNGAADGAGRCWSSMRDGNVVLGVDMGGTKLYGAISEIGGRIIDEAEMERKGASGEDCYDLLTKLIDDLLACPELRRTARARHRGGRAGNHASSQRGSSSGPTR